MQTDIYYRDITRTEALEDFLNTRIGLIAEKFLKSDEQAHLTVRLETERHRTQNRKPSFTCEVLLKPTHTRGLIKIKKTNDDFFTCVSETCEALKKVLKHRSSRLADHHKWDPMLNVHSASSTTTIEDEEEFDGAVANY